MSTHQYVRSIAPDGGYDLGNSRRTAQVDARIAAALPGLAFRTAASGAMFSVTFAAELSGGQVSTLDATVAGYVADVGAGVVPQASAAADSVEAQSLGESSTTGAAFAAKVSLTFHVPPGGLDLRIDWSCEVRVDDGDNRGVDMRVQLDGSATLSMTSHVGIVSDSVLGTPIGTSRTCSGFRFGPVPAGQHVVLMEFRRSGTAGAAFIRRAQLAVRRV